MARLSRSRLRGAACAALLLLGAAAPAHAQEAGEQSAAQDAHRRALELFDHGQFAEALLEFKRAYALAPTFRIQYNIGLSEVALGNAAAAVEAFGVYLREGGDRIPAARRAQVELEVARLSKQLAWLTLEVEDPQSEITLDGVLLPHGSRSRQLRVNSGKHTVAVRSSDGTLKTQTVQVAPGQEQRLHFDAPARGASGAGVQASPPNVQVAAPPQRSLRWITWGVTGALGAGAAVTGILAINAHADERDAQTRQGVTAGELQDARDKVGNLALATDVLLAGTAIAAGVSLYLTLKPSGSGEPHTALIVGPGSLALRGSL